MVAPALAVGTPVGNVYPPAPPPGVAMAIDGRTLALRRLRDYVCALKFHLPGAPPREVSLDPVKQFVIEQPDHEQDLLFPCISVVSGEATPDPIAMVAYLDESSFGKHGANSVLQVQYEHVESVTLEIWASSRAERRAFMGSLETAFNPVEEMSGFVLTIPDYYNETVVFLLLRKGIMDDPDTAKNRRHGFIEVEMRFNVVKLVNARTMQPFTTVVLEP